MEIFEAECARQEIEEDTQKIEALRLFLDESCLDWYSSMLIKHTVNSEWQVWKSNFCRTYADKGWSPVRYAILFKYRQGSLLEYAVKEERLLLEVTRSIDKTTMIDLIATGLPNFIADKIDRDNLRETEDLFNKVRGLEHLVIKKFPGKKMPASSGSNASSENKSREKTGETDHVEFAKKKTEQTNTTRNPHAGSKTKIVINQRRRK